MVFGRSTQDRRKWRSYFAWHPVQLYDGRWAWLTRVWAREEGSADCEYMIYALELPADAL